MICNSTPTCRQLIIHASQFLNLSLAPVKAPVLHSATPLRSPPSLPPPMPLGYHKHQYPSIKPASSRPLTPGEQFSSMHHHEVWEEVMEGQPSAEDVKV